MPDPASAQSLDNPENAVRLMLKSQDDRIKKLEAGDRGSFAKMMTASASTSALFLGLVLTAISIYDAVVTKPEADRIVRISNFNQAVNSAAKTRQDMTQLQMQTSDPKLQLAIGNWATPQILNDISTARAILPYLRDEDVGISQLIILASESATAGDLVSVREFVVRAVGKTDASSYMHSEAKRYEGKYYFLTGDATSGRQSFEEALRTLGTTTNTAAVRANDLADLTLSEFTSGDCSQAAADLAALGEALHAPGVLPLARSQVVATVKDQLGQLRGQHCPNPPDIGAILVE